MQIRIIQNLLCFTLLLCLLMAGCNLDTPENADKPSLARELVFYSWPDDLPQSVMDAFTNEYGVKVIYRNYESSEEALENLRSGNVYDVAVLDNPFIPELIEEGLLARLDHSNIPNFQYISANFRDLFFDPGNHYSVTYNWGLTGLVVRNDLITVPVTQWADLWDSHFAGRLLIWEMKRALIGIALKSLGYSINSENPEQLEEALERLLELKPRARITGYNPKAGEQALVDGEGVLMFGWAGDVLRVRARNPNINFVLPGEGCMQWGDNFVIPAGSPNKYTAEVFINFLLRPEISAQIVNEQYYATANEAAYPFIEPEILNDPVIFPPLEHIQRSEVFMLLSSEGKSLYDHVWQQFLAGAVTEPGKE